MFPNNILDVSSNTIDIRNNATITGNIYGGHSSTIIETGDAIAGTATSPLYSRANGESSIYIPNQSILANENTINIQQATITGNIYGGYSELNAKSGLATAGTANGSGANGNTASSLINAESTILQANQNNLQLNGTFKNGEIYGGYATFHISPGAATGGTSQNNAVNLTGTQVSATDNVINIGENAQFNNNSLYGGYIEYTTNYMPERYDVFSGNTLKFSANPISVNNLANFERYNFNIHPSYANETTPLITANTIVLGANATNMDNSSQSGQLSKVNVTGIHSGNVLEAGDKFILMRATGNMTGNGTGALNTNVMQVQQGISLLYNVQTDVDITNKNATATILACESSEGKLCSPDDGNGGAASINPQLKSLSEGYLAGLHLITRGADNVAYDIFGTLNEQDSNEDLKPFIIMSGQYNRYNSGSHIKSHDFLITGGLGYQKNDLTAAVFLESGWGNYDTYNSFVNVGDVKGEGKNHYYGLGIFGRYDFISNFYVDASMRFGINRNKFDTAHIIHSVTGENAKYTIKSNYISAHIGTGYILNINDQANIDLSAKYLWTQLDGKKIIIAQDPIKFDRVTSNRGRLNATLNYQYSNSVTLNAGLGYEYEFDSKAKATAYHSFDIGAPSVKGSTGILSLGANVKPTENKNLNLDFKLNGYTGQHSGIGASIKVSYAF